jgi:biopolymer transport protein ExbB/TolQ
VNPVVAVIWWIMLIVAGVVVLPVLLRLLLRTWNAARRIEEATERILASAGGVVDNTAAVEALQTTIGAAPTLMSRVESLERHAARIEAALAAQRPGNGKVDRAEV